MKVEHLRIYADDVGLQEEADDLIYACRRIAGEFRVTQKGKDKDIALYMPEADRLRTIISKRIRLVVPEFIGYKWTIGRNGDGDAWIRLYNSDWK